MMSNCSSSALPKAATHRRTLSSVSPENFGSSSLHKIWAGDPFSDELSGTLGTQSGNIIAPPAPVTLTREPFPRSIPLCHDEVQVTPRQPRKHQRSLTALLPFRSPLSSPTSPQRSSQRSPQRSPVKEKPNFEFVPTLTGDKDGQIKIADKSKGGLSGWFNGMSASVPVGLPIDDVEKETVLPPPFVLSRSLSPDRTVSKLRKKQTMSSIETSKTAKLAAVPRFPFFGSKAPTTTTVQIPSVLDDEFLSLDITAALFPGGPPREGDTFSPSAFKNLLTNAEGLLLRLQTAYKLRTLSLHELTAEKEAQADELEEAETRTKHLKLQLEDMAQRVTAHDEEMKKVVSELVAEKQARAAEREAREKSISLIKFCPISPYEGRSIGSEDLELVRQNRRAWRRSDGTVNSDMSLESDDDSAAADSIFSRSMSPVTSEASGSSSTIPEVHEAVMAKMITVGGPLKRPKPVQQKSTFQKILGQMTASGESPTKKEETEEGDELGVAEQGCRNCRGGTASMAWDTVGLLRAENRSLKERVSRLESAVEGALDLVAGLTV